MAESESDRDEVDEYEGLEITFKAGFDDGAPVDDKERELRAKFDKKRKKTGGKDGDNISVFARYLQDKKERRKERKRQRKLAEKNGGGDGDDGHGSAGGEDDFLISLDGAGGLGSGKKRARGNSVDADKERGDKRARAELDLLMIPERYGDRRDAGVDMSRKQDRTFKKLVGEQEKKGKKRGKRNKKKKGKGEDGDGAGAGGQGFAVDTSDARFAAMYNDSTFAIDPTAPRFKKTENMQRILKEKQARRAASTSADGVVTYSAGQSGRARPTGTAVPAAESLVETLKRKHAAFQAKQKAGRGGRR